jgi:hypothetical protein
MIVVGDKFIWCRKSNNAAGYGSLIFIRETRYPTVFIGQVTFRVKLAGGSAPLFPIDSIFSSGSPFPQSSSAYSSENNSEVTSVCISVLSQVSLKKLVKLAKGGSSRRRLRLTDEDFLT